MTIRDVHFDDEHIHVELDDGRIMSVPMRWIPTVYRADPEERAKHELNRSRTMIIWDPVKCAIHEKQAPPHRRGLSHSVHRLPFTGHGLPIPNSAPALRPHTSGKYI